MSSGLIRKDFSLGWQPNFDNVNCPQNALLRMDNCVLDEVGAIVLRRGSAKISPQVALADADVHSLFTAYLTTAAGNPANITQEWERAYAPMEVTGVFQFTARFEAGLLAGALVGPSDHTAFFEADYLPATGTTRYRFWGGGDTVYANGASILANIAGSGDVAFASFLDQIYIARGTTRKKYDGTTVRTWGVAAPTKPYNLALSPPNQKDFATCDSTESPGFTTPSEGTLSFAADWDGTANKALQIVGDATTHRGMATKTFSAATDFTALSNGDTALDQSRISLHCYVNKPKEFISITLLVDVDDGTFNKDYYSFVWENQVQVLLPADEALSGDFEAHFWDRTSILDRVVWKQNEGSPFRQEDASWNYLSATRDQFFRVGGNGSKNWQSVKAIRIILQGNVSTTIRVDTIEISGGTATPLDGKYKWRAQYVFNNGRYLAKSAISPVSAALEVFKGAAEVSVDNPSTALYSAADVAAGKVEFWVYRMGGLMDGFYRTATKVVTAVLGAEQIVDKLSDVDAMKLDIKLDITDVNPPTNIIGMVADYYDRLIALTANTIYPSRRLDPDSFSTGQSIRVGDGSYTAYWIAQANGGVYVGTDKDIFVLEGTGDELPDGTVAFILKPLNIANPPLSKAMAQDGNILFYLASDGWRLFTGNTSVPIGGDVSLLYRGQTRHGVSAVNISNKSSRFRACVNKGQLVVITPEGSDTATTTIHRYDLAKQRWYRQTYGALGTGKWRAILNEPDGTLIASDDARNVWTLDTGTQDNATDIAITLWTKVDDDGTPDSKKDAHDFRVQLDTGGNNASFAMHKDGSGSATNTLTVASTGFGVSRQSNLALGTFVEVQLRITGSFSTFRLLDFTLFYFLNPASRIVWDTGPVPGLDSELFWLREIHIKANAAADLTVTPFFDDTAGTALIATVNANLTKVYQVKVGRGVKGTQTRIRITSASSFIPHWLDVIGARSGMTQERIRVSA